jgi:hypothetical protein
MNTQVASLSTCSTKFVEQARQLPVPTYEQTLRRDNYCYQFWSKNENLLVDAWKEWEKNEGNSLPALDDSLIDPKLRKAIRDAWEDPSKEDAIWDLLEEVSPGVFKCQFLDRDRIKDFREYFDKAAESGIPVRPPYGILLNRKGFMLDERSNGYLATEGFQQFYKMISDDYLRPLGRLCYPYYIQKDDDGETFGFSIQYKPDTETSIREHSDSSTLTFNFNFNVPTEGQENWAGSSLYFIEPGTYKKNYVGFEPGVAVFHLGAIAHAALPIEKGERSNIVMWLMGKNGRSARTRYGNVMTREERWTKPVKDPNEPADTWAPF